MKVEDGKVGSIVVTDTTLGSTAGLMAHRHHMEARLPGARGRVVAVLEPTNDIAVLFVRHGRTEGAYYNYELNLLADPTNDD